MTIYNDNYSYKIVDNGYEIYLNGELIITQYENEREDLAHVYKKDGTYEENCLLQLKTLEEGYDEALNETNVENE